MPNLPQVVGIIEIETTAELSLVLFGSVSIETAGRWPIKRASEIEEAVAADLESLRGDLTGEYDAFCERLAT